MSIYTITTNYLESVNKEQIHLHNVLFKFSNPNCEHKAAIDTGKKLLHEYAAIANVNHDIYTWLDFMTRPRDTYFEIVNVDIPDHVSLEEMYLMIASNTKSCKKIIVGSHQYWQLYNYNGNTCNILYNEHEVSILSKEEALQELNNTEKSNHMNTKNNPWKSGSFYLCAYILLIGSTVTISFFTPAFLIPIVVIAALLGLVVLGAFQLRNDDKLSNKSFIELMKLTLKQLPFLRKKNKG